LNQGVSISATLAIRFGLAALVYSVLMFPRRSSWTLSGRQRCICFLMGAIGYTCQAGLYLGAVDALGSGLASVLLYLYPGAVVIIHSIETKTLPSKQLMVALGLCLAGVIMICDLKNSSF